MKDDDGNRRRCELEARLRTRDEDENVLVFLTDEEGEALFFVQEESDTVH